jgi:hypothetical protein
MQEREIEDSARKKNKQRIQKIKNPFLILTPKSCLLQKMVLGEKPRWQIVDRSWDLDLHDFRQILQTCGSKDQVTVLFL